MTNLLKWTVVAGEEVLATLEAQAKAAGVTDGRVHLHVNVSGEGNVAIHGHLHEAHVKTWFVNAYVVPS
jgi:predicted DNA-binding protein with PD1-like motif